MCKLRGCLGRGRLGMGWETYWGDGTGSEGEEVLSISLSYQSAYWADKSALMLVAVLDALRTAVWERCTGCVRLHATFPHASSKYHTVPTQFPNQSTASALDVVHFPWDFHLRRL